MTRKLQVLITITFEEDIEADDAAALVSTFDKLVEDTLLYGETPAIETAGLDEYLVEEFIQL